MKRTGEILKKERDARGLSLHEIGLSLKINSKILKAIEDGETNALPAKTFLRGFVQSYASYLKLNVDDVLKVFAEEMGSTRPQPLKPDSESIVVHPETENPETANLTASETKGKTSKTFTLEESSTTKGLIFALIAVMLAGLITVTVKVIDRYQREAQVATVEVTPLEDTSPPAENSAMTATSSPLPAPSTSENPTSVVGPVALSTTIPSTNVLPPPTPRPLVPANNSVEIKPVEPKPAVKPVEVKPPEIKPAEDKVPVGTTKPPLSVEKPAPPKLKPVELIVEATEDVEIEYATGSGAKEKTSLMAGQIHTFRSDAGLKLRVSNGGSINVIVNGRDMGTPGEAGKPIRLNY